MNSMKTMLRAALLGSVASAACLSMPAIAGAAEAGAGVDVSEIVVTGSRIRRDTFSSPQPISVISAEAIRESGQTSIGEVLLEQPNINPATNGQNSSNTLFLAGQTRADIRGLGPVRTLVLMDGRRLPFSDASSPAVDLNTIPSLMVERIETIAGGASAVYGSEAISGVVNFIMKKSQDGLEADIQGGITEQGDGEEFRSGFNYGHKFLNGRLNVLIGGEYAKQDKIMQKDRDFAFPGIRRDTRVTPQPILDPTSRSNTSPFATFQVVGGALGTAQAYTLDVRDRTQLVKLSAACSTATVQPDCQDPSLFYGAVYNALQAKSDRAVARTYIDYALTDDFNLFVDATYVKADGYGIFQPAFASAAGGGTLPLVLRGDNAFLNGSGNAATQLRAAFIANGKTLTQTSTAQVGKFFQEFGGRDVKSEREQGRVAVGFNGKFTVLDRVIHTDGYAQYSKLTGSTTSFGVPNLVKLTNAVDAVLVNGVAVCRDLTARAAGCVPFDLVNGPSAAAVQYANAQSTTDQTVKQKVAGINFSADVYDLPAGPVGVAFGAEYRKEESLFVQDAIGATGQLLINSIGTRGGQYSVKEAYGEIRIPILKNLPFANELTVELAGPAWSGLYPVREHHQQRDARVESQRLDPLV